MEQFIPVLGPWLWWVAAGALLILELMAPGVFFIWLGIAAALTGLVDLVFGLNWQSELLVFAGFAVISVMAGRAILKRRPGGDAEHAHLNRRQQGYVGHSYTLKQAIVGGRGKLTIDDTVWEVEGPDLPAGARVKVTRVDGMKLQVAAI